MNRSGAMSRWAGPVGACMVVSFLCLAVLFSFNRPGVPKLGGRRPIFAAQYGHYQGPEHPCSGRNEALNNFMVRAQHAGTADPLLPQRADSFETFLTELKESLEKHHLPMRAIDYLFQVEPLPQGSSLPVLSPSCAGDMLEFGVFTATSTNKTARWRRKFCDASCPPIYGFDTFTGLPEKWTQIADGEEHGFHDGAFSLNGQFPFVEDNIHLVKGLFSDSIPPFLQLQREMTGKDPRVSLPLSYLHIDCDLYAGSRDALTLLSHKIVPGTVILFDELVNYRTYREHEVKALWEWLHVSGAKLATIGMMGPLEGRPDAFDKEITVREHPQASQSAAFVVVHKPDAITRIAW